VTRLKDFNIKKLMPTLRGRPEFMRYFPDTCFKKEPPADFF
jgi:hypothetical protein